MDGGRLAIRHVSRAAGAQAARRGGWRRTETIGRFEIWQRAHADRPQVLIRDTETTATLMLFGNFQ